MIYLHDNDMYRKLQDPCSFIWTNPASSSAEQVPQEWPGLRLHGRVQI